MLEVVKLSKSFDKLKVLKDIDLIIEEGDTIGIMGPSGCGKSTLLRCLNGLEKPTKGQILFLGKDIHKEYDLNYLRRNVGMVFQQFNLFSNMTVLENIILAPVELKIISKEEAIKKAKKFLKDIGLEKKADSYLSELSGGEKQRVAIIRALIMKPKILLFDEPTSALDPKMTFEVLELMKKVKEQGITMVVVSHEINFLKNSATKIIYMENGKIVETGTPKTLFENPKTESLKNFLKNTDLK